MWGFSINYRWAHTCPHTHIHRQPFTQMHTLLLQTEISIMLWSLVKSRAGTSLCPPSSLVHYALRLSGFRKIEEGLKSFREKQVGLEHRLLNPHLHVLPQCLDLFAFPWLRGMWKPKKRPTPLEKVLGRAWLTLDGRLRFSSFLWVSALHSFILPFNKVYQAPTISQEKCTSCWESKDKQVIPPFEELARAITEAGPGCLIQWTHSGMVSCSDWTE